MKIFISSLQVSQGASKGHLHPAIEVGLELKRRGHEVAIMPLPSPFDENDRKQVERCGFYIIEPPALPDGLPLPPGELARLAKKPETVVKAFHSFVVAPLDSQFDGVVDKIQAFNPDVVVYDLMLYAPAIAARKLGIPDVGYCAGLKLIAPPSLTGIYQSVRKALAEETRLFLLKQSVDAHFHQLECLSSTYQLVFTPDGLIAKENLPQLPNVILAGALPISENRLEKCDIVLPENKRIAVLCFGSVLDPANYKDITSCLIDAAKITNCHLIIRSKAAGSLPRGWGDGMTVYDYLPLPHLLPKADIFIHHGGANTFSEAMRLGVPQLLIPLANDQPIQAALLEESGAGIVIKPDEVSVDAVTSAFQYMLRADSPVHERVAQVKSIFQVSNGAIVAADLIDAVAARSQAISTKPSSAEKH